MKNRRCKLDNQGFATLIAVILVTVLLTTIGLGMSLVSVGELKLYGALNSEQKVINLVDACSDEALLYLNNNSLLPSTVSLMNGQCSVVVNSNIGTVWDFNVSASIDGYSDEVNIVADRNAGINISKRTRLL